MLLGEGWPSGIGTWETAASAGSLGSVSQSEAMLPGSLWLSAKGETGAVDLKDFQGQEEMA